MTPIVQNKPLTSSEAHIIEGKLVRIIRNGLAEAGIPTGNRRYGLIFIDSLGPPIGVMIKPYIWAVPVWRITFGVRARHPWPCLFNPQELTFHLGEITTQTGVDLARLLREPDWRWPLFEGDKSYPRYAWTSLAHQTYEIHRLKMEEMERRAKARRALR
jgi:hypothetical protein